MNRETAEQFERRLELTRSPFARQDHARRLVFCRGCSSQHDGRKPCPRCTAFAEGRPVTAAELVGRAP